MSRMVANILPRLFNCISHEQILVLDSVTGAPKKARSDYGGGIYNFPEFSRAIHNHFAFRRLDEWITLGVGSGGCMEPIAA